jgi:ferredoxin
MKLRVNPIRCVAHGLCAELLPEHVTLDEWGYPILDGNRIEPELERLARRAADACPTLALMLERDEQPDAGPNSKTAGALPPIRRDGAGGGRPAIATRG